MPVNFPEFSGSDDNPRQTLVAFVQALREFLAELVETNRDPLGRPLFWPPLLDEMRPAWREVQPRFNDVIQSLPELASNRVQEHGLSGHQLRFKLAVIRFFHSQYLLSGKGVLKKLIDIIDDLLESILKAAGVGDAISEIKDFIKNSVDDIQFDPHPHHLTQTPA